MKIRAGGLMRRSRDSTPSTASRQGFLDQRPLSSPVKNAPTFAG
jgi:hypothetical protein